jgi:hypothetical protein
MLLSSSWDEDDLARMLALEHAFSTITLMWACQFADQQRTKPSKAVAQLREAVLSSVLDSKDHNGPIGALINGHLHRMFEHVRKIAEHADRGY